MVKDNRNCIAFKFNYCDGGADDKNIGYFGVCSKSIIDYNINKAKRTWCSDLECSCKKYLEGIINYETLKNYWSPKINSDDITCFESRIFRDWVTNSGVNINNKEPRQIARRDELIGRLCLLTTVKPNYKEKDRVIFGMFIIKKVDKSIYGIDEMVVSDEKYRLKFNFAESEKLKFWSIYKNPNKPDLKLWGSGLFRYIENNDALQFLKMAVEIKTGTSEEKFAKEFLEYYCRINNIKK